ncbi:MAG TPA: hypothetical protein VL197_03225 [Nitrospirota bacterium]|nr:hypothetical protein [Nitrospirota bacterium]
MQKMITIMAALAFSCATAAAEEHFGVKAYPNVKTDASTDRYCRQYVQESENAARKAGNASIGTEAYCFRTGDGFDRVAAFYRKQKGLELLGNIANRPGNRAAVFCLPEMRCAALGNGVDVTITSPWIDDKKRQNDVMITIRESRQK